MPEMNWEGLAQSMSQAARHSARALEHLARAIERMPRVIITDETMHALGAAVGTSWKAGFTWRRDILRCISYGERAQLRTPRREKRRARKRRGK